MAHMANEALYDRTLKWNSLHVLLLSVRMSMECLQELLENEYR